jgi:hypothetical protein
MRICVPLAGALFFATLCQCSTEHTGLEVARIGRSQQAIFEAPVLDPKISGVFRAPKAGINTITMAWIQDTTFFSTTIPTMKQAGYQLVDFDVDTSTGLRFYSGAFQSGVPVTNYVEADPTDFTTQVGTLSQQDQKIISLHAYTSLSGELTYAALFQLGYNGQLFPPATDYATFTSTIDAYGAEGFALTNLAVYLAPITGEELYLGA